MSAIQRKKFLGFIKRFLFVAFSASIFWVMLYKYLNPPITSLMFIRALEHDKSKGKFRFQHRWVSLDKISENMVWAVVAAEDNNFTTHFGVDWEAIQKARKINRYSRIKHGASTITQQTAKNVFLFPSRTYFRKALELYFTYLMELLWSKRRIMEVYLNVIELGRGIYGVEAAAQYYYKKSASELSASEAAMLAAILPAPLRRNPAQPSSYLINRQQRILNLMNKIGKPNL
ncbi:MAG: monofunctional biosynthetic peptidoglycan transglycosylase [Bacteroidales bacterium]|nr:monofunctional biosynthetic peptidoglycan transglycosylase [Bacteroidales bacterium]